MEPGAIFLLLLVIAIVVLFVARPFTSHWRIKPQSSPKVSTLLAERERALTALMELDFDNGIGKVPTDEYFAQRANLIQKGSDILRQLDEIQGVQATPVNKLIGPTAADSNATTLSDEDLEELIAKQRLKHQQKTAGFCPNCGKPILPSSRVPYLYYWNASGLRDLFGRPLPVQFGINVSSAMDIKEKMLACHASQGVWLAHLNKSAYLEQMKEQTRRQGQAIGRQYGECFIQHRGSGHPQDNILGEILGDLCVSV